MLWQYICILYIYYNIYYLVPNFVMYTPIQLSLIKYTECKVFDTKSGALRLNTRREGPDEKYRAVSMPPTLLGSLHPMRLFERPNGLKHPAGIRVLFLFSKILFSSHWKSA